MFGECRKKQRQDPRSILQYRVVAAYNLRGKVLTVMNKKIIAGVAILCALPTLAQASGFALIEMNARGQGNA
jgi:hypothetical protein